MKVLLGGRPGLSHLCREHPGEQGWERHTPRVRDSVCLVSPTSLTGYGGSDVLALVCFDMEPLHAVSGEVTCSAKSAATQMANESAPPSLTGNQSLQPTAHVNSSGRHLVYDTHTHAAGLCGFEPFFDDRGDQYMFKRILNCDYEFVSPWWDDVSLNAKDLVKKLIVQDPKKRLTTLQALEHPWVTGKAVNFAHMDTAQKKLQEFNARRKLKAAVKAVVASTRLGSAGSHGSSDSSKNSCSHSPIQEGAPEGRPQDDQPQTQKENS
ncbi:hypothetical protein JZ751_011776 [Albula glossodonta]|uniref:Protein kinase domain-containing protein n=1 Tax=Albula glossodonta TaxID=121402 RepID=A0A8T2PQM9_9TELE|nr:hypothetical protein JZ751_011776 [Albula glossodonta]